MPKLRVATWNIGGGLTAATAPDRFETPDLDYFASTLQLLQPDVVCLQELHIPLAADQPHQAELLSQALGLPFYASQPCDQQRPSHLDAGCLLGLGMLSRFPIVSAHYHQLPNPQLELHLASGAHWISHDKGFLVTGLEVEGQVVNVLTGHNVPFAAFRRDFLERAFNPIRAAIEALVLKCAGSPTIVAGDLNDERIEQLLPGLFAAGFTPAFRGVSTEPLRGRQLDHVLFSSDWQLLQYAVIPGRADHYLCVAELELKGQQTLKAPHATGA